LQRRTGRRRRRTAAARGGAGRRTHRRKSISRQGARFGPRLALERRARHGEVNRRGVVPRNAAEATRTTAGRQRPAARRRRAGHDGLEHGEDFQSHQRLSYLAAEVRRRLPDDRRRRGLGSTAAARQGRRRRWVNRVSATGAKPRGGGGFIGRRPSACGPLGPGLGGADAESGWPRV
jgi:hypothetical protein